MQIKSFSDYFKGYKNYDDGGKLDQRIVADAQKVFETLKSPKAIDSFIHASVKTQNTMVPGLDEGHSGASFAAVCSLARRYSTYKAIHEPFTFLEYFKGYENYDDGGKLDQRIVADAQRVFEKCKSLGNIDSFIHASVTTQYKMVPGLDEGHSGASFAAVCSLARQYAEYAAIKEEVGNTFTKDPRMDERDK
ncbi:MAG: hypothetical protein ILP11_03750 [Alphaproteobacteria bacterium]|nr:hypothetical protein [Alphaproteobacteria bacterium]